MVGGRYAARPTACKALKGRASLGEFHRSRSDGFARKSVEEVGYFITPA